ncbi:MAG: NAD(+) synthase [Muribaculaceae bacterium]|nr:NAD(+) synthase [Muribaculaceae bacterium]
MDNFGFYRVRAFVPEVKIADIQFNGAQIINALIKAESDKVDCVVFPELSITGYTCGDLFQQEILMKSAEEQIIIISEATKDLELCFALGCPIMAFGKRYNCAVMICGGEIMGIVPKSYLPNYNEFYEKRWFESGKNVKSKDIKFGDSIVPFGTDLIFKHKEVNIGVEICEDLWVPSPPSSYLAMAGAELILNLSASDDLIGKYDYLVSLITQQSARCRCAYAYSSAGWGESSTDLVFSGKAIIAEDGNISDNENKFLTQSFFETKDIDIEKLRSDRSRFNTFVENDSHKNDFRFISNKNEIGNCAELKEPIIIDPLPFVPKNPISLNQRCEEIINIQSYGLMKRLKAINCRKAVIGISGGLDSTLALLVTVHAFDKLNINRNGIIGVTMPGLATSSRTKNNAFSLMENLGVKSLEIPIGKAVEVHFNDINQDPKKFDATYENSQARERTQILMDLANKENGIVIGTGDMSELALGWCTYNGDQMSMYGVNSSVPKTLVKHLVKWFASKMDKTISDTLTDICDTPISPELIPSSSDDITQKTEDLVGPYDLHDFFLYYFLRYGFSPLKIYYLSKYAFKDVYKEHIILKWLKVFIKRFFTQQFKRSCMPDGPKVGSVNLSPRGDWRMPSDASYQLWLSQLNEIEFNNET